MHQASRIYIAAVAVVYSSNDMTGGGSNGKRVGIMANGHARVATQTPRTVNTTGGRARAKAHEIVVKLSVMRFRFPGESAEYRAARAQLLTREIALRQAMEAVAVARRALPPGGLVPDDYVFQGLRADSTPGDVKLSELFAPGEGSLAIYSFMFPRDPGDLRPGPASGQTAQLKLDEGPCPSCTALLDQLDGAIEHVSQRLEFAVVARAPLDRLLALAADRGWRRLRLLSSAANHYNRDYHGETAQGSPMPMLNVFRRDGAAFRHFWGSELLYAPTEPEQDPRHVGTIEPLWNLLDFTPEGRGVDWNEQLNYCCAPSSHGSTGASVPEGPTDR